MRTAETVAMAIKTGMKKVSVTVGDLIAAVFDVVGDQVDQAVDLLRFDALKRRSMVVIEGAMRPPNKNAS